MFLDYDNIYTVPNSIKKENPVLKTNPFTSVTKLSKIVALTMFVILPFAWFYLGMLYQRSLAIKLNDSTIIPADQQTNTAEKSTMNPTTPLPQTGGTQVSEKPCDEEHNTYTSKSLGIEFDYASCLDESNNQHVKVQEQGNKIFVYLEVLGPTSGQSVEVFSKDLDDTLEEAIEKTILSGISNNDCFIEKRVESNKEYASINYPVPEGEFPGLYGEKCPIAYRSTNGIRYFQMSLDHPSKYFFFSIGQYWIPSGLGKDEDGNIIPWEHTVRFVN